LNVIHAADIRHLQQFADFLPPGLFFRRAILSGHQPCGQAHNPEAYQTNNKDRPAGRKGKKDEQKR